MPALLFLVCFFMAPAVLMLIAVRLVLIADPGSSRARILRICVPFAAILPLLPVTAMVASSSAINNALPIAIVATAMGAVVVAVCVCLPVGLALTRHIAR